MGAGPPRQQIGRHHKHTGGAGPTARARPAPVGRCAASSRHRRPLRTQARTLCRSGSTIRNQRLSFSVPRPFSHKSKDPPAGHHPRAAPPRPVEMGGRAAVPGDGAAADGVKHNHVTHPPRANARPRQSVFAENQQNSKSMSQVIFSSFIEKGMHLPRVSTLYRIGESFCVFSPRRGAVGGRAAPPQRETAPTSW
ncbi:hypothetical protein TcG_07035 [Trypanosoma cruzi]|nr:hypothetical protein TcG_07035 [Trypanosoma cruzi]